MLGVYQLEPILRFPVEGREAQPDIPALAVKQVELPLWSRIRHTPTHICLFGAMALTFSLLVPAVPSFSSPSS